MSVVDLVDVKKHYMFGETRVEALRGVSLEIDRGEFLAIAGPSGAGKSTILNMIGCIDTPSEGKVLIDGQEVEELNNTELTRIRRNRIGFIFQSFNLIAVLDVHENIEFPRLLQRSPSKREREQAVMRVIEEVGLADRIHNKLSKPSGFMNISDLSYTVNLKGSFDLSKMIPFSLSLGYNGGGDGNEFTVFSGDNALSLTAQVSFEY